MFNKYHLAILIIIPLLLGAGCQISQNTNINSPTPVNQPVPPAPVVTKGASLNLSNKGLTALPKYVLDRTDLQELNISYNSLTGSLPGEIRWLQNLEILNASYNKMTGVPAEVGQLSKLKILDLSYNQLTGLPNEIANLKQLQKFILIGNNPSEQDLQVIKNALPNLQIIY